MNVYLDKQITVDDIIDYSTQSNVIAQTIVKVDVIQLMLLIRNFYEQNMKMLSFTGELETHKKAILEKSLKLRGEEISVKKYLYETFIKKFVQVENKKPITLEASNNFFQLGFLQTPVFKKMIELLR